MKKRLHYIAEMKTTNFFVCRPTCHSSRAASWFCLTRNEKKRTFIHMSKEHKIWSDGFAQQFDKCSENTVDILHIGL